MSVIVDGILGSPEDAERGSMPAQMDLEGKSFMTYMMDFIDENIKEHGDWDFVVNADLGKKGGL